MKILEPIYVFTGQLLGTLYATGLIALGPGKLLLLLLIIGESFNEADFNFFSIKSSDFSPANSIKPECILK